MVGTFLSSHYYGQRSQHNSRESQRRFKLKISLPDQTNPGLDFYDHIACWVSFRDHD
jgi:hypothetical protein